MHARLNTVAFGYKQEEEQAQHDCSAGRLRRRHSGATHARLQQHLGPRPQQARKRRHQLWLHYAPLAVLLLQGPSRQRGQA